MNIHASILDIPQKFFFKYPVLQVNRLLKIIVEYPRLGVRWYQLKKSLKILLDTFHFVADSAQKHFAIKPAEISSLALACWPVCRPALPLTGHNLSEINICLISQQHLLLLSNAFIFDAVTFILVGWRWRQIKVYFLLSLRGLLFCGYKQSQTFSNQLTIHYKGINIMNNHWLG